MSVYDDLVERVNRIWYLQSINEVLNWDQQVVMPPNGVTARAKQVSALDATTHEYLTAEKTGRLLSQVNEAECSPRQQAVLREVQREYDRAASVPTALVEQISEAASNAFSAWEEAKEKSDFNRFAPHLEELLALKKQYAEHINPDQDPYAVLFADFEPYLGLDTASSTLTQLENVLPSLISDIRATDWQPSQEIFHGSFPIEQQKAFSHRLLSDLGFDETRGRLDTSSHPFTGGNQFDARITTRYQEEDLLSGVMPLIHEFGHALYQLQLPDDAFGTPLGAAMEMTVHESQSRLWENHIARSKPFWRYVLPKLQETFPAVNGTVQDAFNAVNQVKTGNMIRVEADELTYHLHIVLRFRLEQALFNDELTVDEVPEAWNNTMEDLFSLRPDNDAEGCLQDVHWSRGAFGYFPTYSLGSVLAAQVMHALEKEFNIDDLVEKGDFAPVQSWLAENIHQHGRRYKTNALIREATGEPFNPDYFVDYIQDKYTAIYNL